MYFRLGKIIKIVTEAWATEEFVKVQCPFCGGTKYNNGYICVGCGAEYVEIDIKQGDKFYIV